MRKKLIKRGVSLLTTAALVAGLLNGLENLFVKQVEAAETVKYEPKVVGVNLIPDYMTTIPNFMRDYVIKDGGYNITSKYLAKSWKKLNGKINVNDSLSTERKYWHSGNDHWEANFEFDISGYSVLRSLINSNQIVKGYHTYLTSDYHKHIGTHNDKKWDVAKLSNNDTVIKSEKKQDGEGQLFEGKDEVGAYTDKFTWNMSHEGCNCGSSAVSDSVIYLVDKEAPRVKRIYISSDSNGDNKMNSGSGFKANQTGYVVMEFSEYIRFGNNKKEELKLNLELFGTGNDQQVTNGNVTATLISLKDDKMIFEFKVPEKLNGKNTNVYVKNIAETQDWVNKGAKDFPYVLLNSSGKAYSVNDNVKSDLKCSSKITDLAGNPVSWNVEATKIENSKIYFDNVSPELNKITISGSMISGQSTKDKNSWGADIDRSSVFAGVGDTMDFSCYFTEKLDISNNANVKAVLNIKDKNGNQVKLGLKQNRIEDGKNVLGKDAAAERVSILDFNTLTIQEGMQPVTEDGKPIQIVGIEGLTDAVDSVGNKLKDVTSITKTAAQQEYLDVKTPVAYTTLEKDASSGKYTPSSEGGFVFTVPIYFDDHEDEADGAYSSGVTGKYAQFALIMDNNHPYEWYVDGNAGVVNYPRWKSGTTGSDIDNASLSSIPQFPKTNMQYLHIRLDKREDYDYIGSYFDAELRIYTEDYAGNKGMNSFELYHDVDNEKPGIYIKNQRNKALTDGSAEITIDVNVKDRFGLGNKLTYEYDNVVEEVALSGGTDETVTIKLKIPKSDIDNRSKSFTINVADRKGNVANYTGYAYYKFKKISSDYSIINRGNMENPLMFEDMNIIINKPSPVILENNVSEETRTMMLIPMGTEQINGETQNVYLAFMQSGDTGKNIFASLPESEFDLYTSYPFAEGYWYKIAGNVAKDENGEYVSGTFSQLESYSDKNLYKVSEMIKSIYGEREFIFVTSTEFAVNSSDSSKRFNFSTDTLRNFIETETFNIAGQAEYSVDFTDVINSDGESETDNICIAKDEHEISKNSPVKSLKNIFVNINITNEKEKDQTLYGYTRIDTSQCKYVLEEVNSKKAENERYYYSGSILATESQLLSFPVDVQETGVYSLKVVITTYDGSEYTFEPDYYLYIDKSDASMRPYRYDKAYVNEKLSQTITVKGKDDYLKDELISENADRIKIGMADVPSDEYTVNPAENSKACNRLTFTKSIQGDFPADSEYSTSHRWQVRAWSVSDENGEKNAPWYSMEDSQGEFFFELVKTDSFTEDIYNTITDADNNILPVLPLAEGDNLVYYEIKKDDSDAVRNSVILQVGCSSPEFALSEQYHYKNHVAINIEVSDELRNGGKKAVWSEGYSDILMDYIGNYNMQNTYDNPCEVIYFVSDLYGNLSTKNYSITDVDATRPIDRIEKINDGNKNGYHFKYYVYDETGISPENVTAIFNARYSSLLMGMSYDEWKSGEAKFAGFTMPVNKEGDKVWESYDDSCYGIYRTKLEEGIEWQGEKGFSIEVWGEYKFNPYITEDTDEYINYQLQIYSYDDYGNSSNGCVVDTTISSEPEGEDTLSTWISYNYPNKKPELKIESLTDEGWPIVTSDTQIESVKGYGAGTLSRNLTGSEISCSATLPMICVDGEYEIEYTDLFGTVSKQTIPVNLFDMSDISVKFSESGITNNNVVVSVETVNEDDAITEISATYDDGTAIAGEIDKADTSKSSINMERNGKILVKTKAGKTHILRVTNIDTILEEAAVVFSYNGTPNPKFIENSEDTIYTEATAIVTCTEDIDGVNGKLSYTFPYGSRKGDTYTFEYMDQAGNTGEITAVLPYNIEKKTEDIPDVDVTAPEYRMTLSGIRNDKGNYLADYYTGDQGTDVSQAVAGYKAQKYELRFDIKDDSKTKILLRTSGADAVTSYSDSNYEINGVKVVGTTIMVNENAAFDVYIVDEADNVTAITGFEFNGVRNTAPKVTTVYEHITTDKGYDGVRVWFNPENDKEIIPMTPGISAIQKTLSDGRCILQYFKDYEENTTEKFTYKDIYGNSASVKVDVQALDTEMPVITSRQWYGIGNITSPDKMTTRVSNDVTVQLVCSKAISDVKFYEYDDAAVDKKGAIVTQELLINTEFKGTTATLTYTGNVDRKLVAELTASGNGRSVSEILPVVTCIDKDKPVVTVKKETLSSTHTSDTYIFETNEPTLFSKDSKAKDFKTEHEWTVTDNGQHTFKFTDAAGNVTEYTVNTDCIDDKNLVLSFSRFADGSGAVNTTKDMNLQEGESIYVQSNKPADIYVSENKMSVQANQWTKVSMSEGRGIYVLKAVDSVTKREVYESLIIKENDTMAPVIKFDSTSVVLDENTSVEAMKAAVRQGVTILDNRDGEITEYTVNGVPDKVESGYYTIEYTVSDKAGNKSIASRMLHIKYRNEPEVLINGLKAIPYGITNADTNQILTEVDTGLQGGVMIKCKSGIKTTGQMKYGSELMENKETFKAEQPGYYTIYVRTADRKEYIYYVYVDLFDE